MDLNLRRRSGKGKLKTKTLKLSLCICILELQALIVTYPRTTTTFPHEVYFYLTAGHVEVGGGGVVGVGGAVRGAVGNVVRGWILFGMFRLSLISTQASWPGITIKNITVNIILCIIVWC